MPLPHFPQSDASFTVTSRHVPKKKECTHARTILYIQRHIQADTHKLTPRPETQTQIARQKLQTDKADRQTSRHRACIEETFI